MELIITIFVLLLIVGILVFVHELGHFLAAKISGVPVEEFAIGFGKTIFQKKYKGTEYKINLLPLGGYVQLEGEDGGVFRNKSFRVKAFVLLAGIMMNIVLAIILLTFYLSTNSYRTAVPSFVDHTFTNTQMQESLFPLVVNSVDPEGPSVGKFFDGDVIVKVNNEKFSSFDDFLSKLEKYQTQEIPFSFLDLESFDITERSIEVPQKNEDGTFLKVAMYPYDSQSGRPTYFIKYNENIVAGASMTYDFFVYQFKALGSILGNAFSTGDYTEVSNSVGGLPSIGNQIGQAVSFNAYEILIPLTALFSINLAMINILPFPALDGGQLFIAFLERITRRRVPDSILNKINFFGFVFLMGLGLLITFKDIIQLNWIGSIGDLLRGIVGR